jgi:glycosyltransferase involved in cell wall biosynthesis
MVSIVIPVYNGANYLREAIDSALAQTYPDIEIIVVNDGSNDGGSTRDVALSFGDRIRYLEKDNGGVATALNLGIREMRGEYFSWLSHDDLYSPDKIARQLARLDRLNDRRIIPFCNSHIIDHASHITGTGFIPESVRENSILLVVGTYLGGCSLLIPKTAFETAGLFNESLMNCQDNELWLRMVMKGYRLRYMEDVLVKSRQHAEQGSRTTSVRHTRETRGFYLWALKVIGGDYRVENATELFRILAMKRMPSPATHFFRMLSDDRSFGFALSTITNVVFDMTKSLIIKRFMVVPKAGGLVHAVKRWRFRSSSHYWERRYQRGETSGAGSYGRYAEFKAEVLNRFVAANGILTVAEFGCGDGNQLKKCTFAQYLGIDISPAAVEMCRRMYHHDQTKTFLAYTGAEAVALIRQFGAALTISLDVIYHLVEDAVFEEHITNLFELSLRYVIIYSTNFDRRYDCLHQVDRKFTEYIEKNIGGWRLVEVLTNPHKGADTQSDFYIYEKMAG